MNDTQRAAWTSLGASIVRTDSLGETYTLTGINAYISVNRIRNTYGAASTYAAPALVDIFAEQSYTFQTDLSPFDLSVTPSSAIVAPYKLAVYATRPMSQGISFQPTGAYKLLGVYTVTPAGPIDLTADYVALFGEPLEYQKILFRLELIEATGFKSVPVNDSYIVTPL